MSPKDEFNELSFYTLAHNDTLYFIHQHVVDAFQAQTADKDTKTIGLVFSLVGLHLFIDRGYTGRAVQKAHMMLSQNKKMWPQRPLPVNRGAVTVSDVIKSAPGEERDKMITAWCASVWHAYADWHSTIATLVKTELGV